MWGEALLRARPWVIFGSSGVVMEENGAQPQSGVDFRAFAALIFCMVAAGAAAGYVFDATLGRFDAKLPDVPSASEKQIQEGIVLQQAGTRKSSAFGCACAGAIIAGTLGLVLGFASGNAARAIVGALVGILLGAGFGAGGGYVSQEASDYTISHGTSSTTAYMLISAAFWLPIGAAAGIVGVFAGPKAMSNGARFAGPFTGALLAAVLTPILASIVFPLDYKGRIPPRETAECYFVGGAGATLIAIGAGMICRRRIESS